MLLAQGVDIEAHLRVDRLKLGGPVGEGHDLGRADKRAINGTKQRMALAVAAGQKGVT